MSESHAIPPSSAAVSGVPHTRQARVRREIAAGNADPSAFLVYSVEKFKAQRWPLGMISPRRRMRVGGLSDRIKGVILCYVIAVLSERAFFVEWNDPFDLEDIFEPGALDWRLPPELARRRRWREIDLIDGAYTQAVREAIGEGRLLTEGHVGDLPVKLFANCPVIDLFQQSPFAYRLAEAGLDNSSFAALYQSAFGALFSFRPTPDEARELAEFGAFRESVGQIVGLQFRSGGDGKWREGQVIVGEDPSRTHERWPEAVRALDAFVEAQGLSTVGVHVATDSSRARDQLVSALAGRYRLHYLEDDVVHSERSSADEVRSGIRRVTLDNEMLTRCDHILTGAGAFGRMAAWRTGREPATF